MKISIHRHSSMSRHHLPKYHPTVIPAFFVIPAYAGIHSAMEKAFYVYMLASERNGTLYLGVTSDLVKRIW